MRQTAPIDAGSYELPDGGIADRTRTELRVSARFAGGEENEALIGCDRRESTTDLDEAPKELGVALRVEPLTPDPTGSPTSALSPRGLDAGRSP